MCVTPAPTGAAIAMATTPAVEIRAFAVTRVVPAGTTRGTAADRVTRYAFWKSRKPKASV